MKYILSILIILSSLSAIGQGTPTYQGNTTSISYNRGTVGALRMQLLPRGFYPFPTFDTLGTIWVDSANTRGLFYHNGTVRLRLASVPYVDSIAASIEAGSVDSSIYSTVTRLSDSLHSLRDYVDSNNTIIYGNIATLQSDIVTIDSAVGVAFGAIADLYDTKADKDTLNNFLLKSDTATLSNRINLKQNYSDTTTWDATRYWVSTQIPSLSGYVPYTGATTNVNLGTHTISAYNGVINHVSGSGTALSVTKGGNGEALTVTKTSGSGNAMSVSGGVTQLSELHTTTAIADAYIASAATWNAKYGTNDTGRAATNIVTGGSLNKVRDSLAALSGGGSSTLIKANEFNMLYKANGDTTIRGTTKVRVDTTDLRMEFAYDTTTSTVTTDPHGGVKIWGSNRMGMGAVRINDTVSIPAALQRAINTQITGSILPLESGNFIQFTGTYAGSFPGTITITSSPALAYVNSTYSSTSQQAMYSKLVISTTALANISASIRVGSASKSMGLLTGNTKFSGGGGRGTFMFCLPSYNAGERIGVGYTTQLSAITTDVSALIGVPLLFVGKDAADSTFNFFHGNNLGGVAPTKVAIPVTPNQNDVYRVTVYVAPNSTFYMQFEVISKTGAIQTFVLNPTTDIPAVGSPKMVAAQFVNSAATGVAVTYGLIQHIEEIY